MFSRLLATIAALFFVIHCQAANYYFSANGNDSYTSTQAQSKSTPWQSISKLNSYFTNIKAGDSILFKCGETFSGTITITQAGTAAKPIIISSYGSGAKPIITGFTAATGWTALGGGIYQANCPGATSAVNIVLINGVAQPLGRYPNANAANGGYINIDSHVADKQITSSAFNTSVDWTGGEVVIRKNHWTIDRGTISSNTANVINYTDVSSFQPLNNFGFFIQNHPKTLDQQGEWYYNTIAKTLQLYNGSASPAAYNVQVGSLDNLVNVKNKNYITVTGLAFTGANNNTFQLLNSNYFTINNCDISFSGASGVSATNSHYFTITNNTFTNSNNLAVYVLGCNYSNISKNIIKDNGLVAGMGQASNLDYSAINCKGDGGQINNNDIENIGYDGISISGDSITVKNNFISNFTRLADDGGGIYVWGAKDTLNLDYGRQIISNIIVNGNRATNGTSGTFQASAVGIYLDDNSSGVTVTGNTVSGCPGGIKLHNAQNNIITSNTLFNNDLQIGIMHDATTYTTKNLTIKSNIFFSLLKTQPVMVINSVITDVGRMGTFSGNYYSNVIDNQFPFTILNKALNLPMWQSTYSKDAGSSLAIAVPYYTLNQTSKRSKFKNSTFASNVTGASSYSVNGNFKIQWQSKLDQGSLYGYFTTISGSANNGESISANIGAVDAANKYVIKFSLMGTKTSKRMSVYLINTASPYNGISERQYAMVDVNRTENTFIFSPTVSSAGATVVIAFEDEDQSIWIDNLGVYEATGTVNDPNDNVMFAYNASTSNKTINLSGSYVDVKNQKYSGTTTLAPFSSIILIKDPDTLLTAPPVVYDSPNAAKNMTAFNTIKKPKINVYPNPASDYLKFNINNLKKATDAEVNSLDVKILNSQGDVILSQKVQVVNNSYQINFPSKPQPGAYFIQLNGKDINQTSKFIVM